MKILFVCGPWGSGTSVVTNIVAILLFYQRKKGIVHSEDDHCHTIVNISRRKINFCGAIDRIK